MQPFMYNHSVYIYTNAGSFMYITFTGTLIHQSPICICLKMFIQNVLFHSLLFIKVYTVANNFQLGFRAKGPYTILPKLLHHQS